MLPVAGEPLGEPDAYGHDRTFVHLRNPERADDEIDARMRALAQAGHPVITLTVGDAADLGRIFFFAEFATAVAGWVLGINPFDQPNVQEAKDRTNVLLAAGGELDLAPEGSPEELFAQAREGDYVCIQAFVNPTDEAERRLAALARRARQETGCVVTCGFGPRYLHSTGQLHKGGPNTGLFLQVVEEYGDELKIPGKPFGFARLIRAQAEGDFQSLKERGRSIVRVRLEEVT
jgi:glucose-6-phosphate isomerase/transaldolase/glucose-6-phosphate isomerase